MAKIHLPSQTVLVEVVEALRLGERVPREESVQADGAGAAGDVVEGQPVPHRLRGKCKKNQ